MAERDTELVGADPQRRNRPFHFLGDFETLVFAFECFRSTPSCVFVQRTRFIRFAITIGLLV